MPKRGVSKQKVSVSQASMSKEKKPASTSKINKGKTKAKISPTKESKAINVLEGESESVMENQLSKPGLKTFTINVGGSYDGSRYSRAESRCSESKYDRSSHRSRSPSRVSRLEQSCSWWSRSE